MNLWLRLLVYFLRVPFRKKLQPPFDISRLAFRVLPTDLDVNFHMNNGRYLTLMDIGRFDLMVGMGLAGPARKNGWIPVLSAASVSFRRELRLFQKFTLESRILWWSGTQLVMEHRIVIATGERAGETAAIALMCGGLYERNGRRFVPVEELIQALGIDAASPDATPEVEAALSAAETLREAARAK